MATHINTPEWVKDAVFYQIFPDRFATSSHVPKPKNLQAWDAPPTHHGFKGGDLLGVVEKLDYLKSLGVNAIYFNPIFASTANHRYHTHDYYVVDPLLGGNPAFFEMLEAAHANGFRVVIDGVFNHASRGFFQFNHLLEAGRESPYVDWFYPYGWPLNAYNENERPNYAAWWGLHALPKFNAQNPMVREFLWNVATYWLEQGVDGWRLDVPAEIDDDSFWREFRRRCKQVNPEAYIVGELWGDAHRWLSGDQFDAQMNYPFMRAALGFFGGHNLDQRDTIHTGLGYIQTLDATGFAQALTAMHEKYHPEIVQAQLNMLGSHDTPRVFTIVNGDLSTLSLLFLCQMTVAGAPNIYYGDEIGLPGGRDPDSRRAFPWHDEASWRTDLLADVRRFVALRHSTPALRRGDFRVLYAERQVVVFQRRLGDEVAVVAFNAGFHEHGFTVHQALPANLVSALDPAVPLLRADNHFTLSPRSGVVWVGRS
ncbi:MAG: alpha-amylase [Chloroflexi bacterium]|mgnify:CR=1 FL=1|nr:alpha-amylase [Chloroflexota bacterium]